MAEALGLPEDDLSQIPEGTGIEAFGVPLKQQTANERLHAIRAQFPFVMIMPFPYAASEVVLQANAPRALTVPDGAIIGCFRGSDDYYVSAAGRARVPTVASLEAQSLFRPDYTWFYLGGRRQFSVVSPFSNVVVQLHCFVN